jgi:hypothetical protein
MKTIDSVIVTFDSETDIMVIGRKRTNESLDIVNAFKGDKATRLWNELTKSEEEEI